MSEAGDESTLANGTALEIVESTAQELNPTLNNSTHVFHSMSLESVAQPTTNSLSAFKCAQMAETAIDSKQNKDHKLQTEVGDKAGIDSPCTTKTVSYQKQPPKSSRKIDIVAKEKGRNIVKIWDNDQDREPKDQPPSSDNSEVSHIRLNMLGVGTFSVTKIATIGMRQMNVKTDSEKSDIADTQHLQRVVFSSSGSHESEALKGFAPEEISTMPETEECVTNKLEEVEEQTSAVAEVVYGESEHTKVDVNGSVHMDENESERMARLELQDPVK
jgi:hypothetical protein